MRLTGFWAAIVLVGCGGGGSNGPPLVLGEDHAGQYNLGPVEWTGSFNNACSPYPAEIVAMEGDLLAGVSNAVGGGDTCDACVEITTALGHSVIAHVVTYGDTVGPGDLDVSSAAYAQLTEDEYPRDMTWHLVSCPTGGGPMYVQYQTGANEWWTSLWIRNPRILVQTVEVQSANHPSFTALDRGTDGTFTDGGGFGAGAFTLRVTGVDGSSIDLPFDGFTPGALVDAGGNL